MSTSEDEEEEEQIDLKDHEEEKNDVENNREEIQKNDVKVEGSNGIYWKYSDSDSVYWSDDKNNFKETLKFKTEKEYFDNREKNNYKRDWSDIKVKLSNGMYWKFKNKDTIYWSENNEPNKSITFRNSKDFFKHRIKNKFKKDWSDIKEFTNDKILINKSVTQKNVGMYWKFKNEDTIYWSNNNEPNKTIRFKNSKDFFKHRVKNKFKKDWSDIKEFTNEKENVRNEKENVRNEKENVTNRKKENVTNRKKENVTNRKKENVKNIGMYWKFKDEGTIFWSENSDPNKSITFKNSKDFFKHREKNNFKKDWSDIKEFTKENKENNTEVKNKGIYWRFENEGTIYWSDSNKPNKTITFHSASEFFDHKEKNNLSKDWSNIKIFSKDNLEVNKGIYWQFKNNKTIYWSNNDKPIKTITFKNKKEFFKHRLKNNLRKDLSNIKKFTKKMVHV